MAKTLLSQQSYRTTSLSIGVAVAFLLSMSAFAYDDNFAICKDELSSIELRINACEHAAERVNSDAQLILGALYLGGLAEEVTEQDANRGYEWIFKAAKSDNTDAQLALGVMYYRGRGVNRDSYEAFKWFLKASENGNSTAQHNLASLYLHGIGVEADSELAVTWLKRAAIQGLADAQYELGLMYAGEHGAVPNFGEAVVWFRKAAEQGHIDAQYALGRMYELGLGVEHDNQEAQTWLRLAGAFAEKIRLDAEQGDPNAQRKLGYIFLKGKGVQRDEEKARQWLKKAADQGDQRAADALSFLATLDDKVDEISESITTALTKRETMRQQFDFKLDEEYRKGDGRRRGKSDIWYKRAAEEGDAEAQHVLGVMYGNGEGVSQDYVTARGWLEKSAAQGNAGAQYALGIMHENGHGVTQDYGAARTWYEQSAAQGNPGAQYALGVMYAVGRGVVTQNYSQAREWFEESAERGDSDAQHALGIMHESGYGVAPDYAAARTWYEKSASQGNAAAQYALGIMHQEGLGVTRDYAVALAWLDKSAAQGDGKAQYALGVMYEEGQGVAQDYGTARTWYEESASQGNAAAQYALGIMHQEGLGVTPNYEKAIAWFRKSAAQGDADAQVSLGLFLVTGTAVDSDSAQAVNLWKEAAHAGHGMAHFYLGIIHMTERFLNSWPFQSPRFEFTKYLWKHSQDNVQSNDLEANVWFLRFIDWADKYDIESRSSFLKQKVKEAEFYVQLIKERKEETYAAALFEVGRYHMYGINGIQRNLNMADSYFRKAASYGEPRAVKHFFSRLASNGSKTNLCKPLLVVYGGAWDDEPTPDENYRRWWPLVVSVVFPPAMFVLGPVAEVSYSGSGIIRDGFMKYLDFVYGDYGIEQKYFGVKLSVDKDAIIESADLVTKHLSKFPESPIVLIGHSWGGSVAYEVAKQVENAIVQPLLVTLDAAGKYEVAQKNISSRWITVHSVRPFFSKKDWSDRVAEIGNQWGHVVDSEYYRFDGRHADVVGMYSAVYDHIHEAILCK